VFDSRVTARLTQVMARVKNMDPNSIRGERNVAEGVATDESKSGVKAMLV